MEGDGWWNDSITISPAEATCTSQVYLRVSTDSHRKGEAGGPAQPAPRCHLRTTPKKLRAMFPNAGLHLQRLPRGGRMAARRAQLWTKASTPDDRLACFRVLISSSAVYESRPLVGSSRTRTAGSVTNSMPMVTL